MTNPENAPEKGNKGAAQGDPKNQPASNTGSPAQGNGPAEPVKGQGGDAASPEPKMKYADRAEGLLKEFIESPPPR
ncbi:hypothetical protein [Methylobacterium tarhaniae]|uniref:hypothetical protein n=1 Tax=Methylobacterium tarhaniae TaxID=1187852 RepID=UPI003CFF2E16